MKVAAYFFIPVDIITDDAKDLPDLDQLKVDEGIFCQYSAMILRMISKERSRSTSSPETGG